MLSTYQVPFWSRFFEPQPYMPLLNCFIFQGRRSMTHLSAPKYRQDLSEFEFYMELALELVATARSYFCGISFRESGADTEALVGTAFAFYF